MRKLLKTGAGELSKEISWVIVAQLCTLIGGLLTFKLLTNILPQEDFGTFSIMFSLASLLVALLFTPLGKLNVRFVVLAQQSAALPTFHADQHKMAAAIVIASAVLLIPLSVYLAQVSSTGLAAYASTLLLTVAMGYQAVQQHQLMAFRLRAAAGISQLIGAISRPLCVVLGTLFVGLSGSSAALGLAAGFAILVLCQHIALRGTWTHSETTDANPQAIEDNQADIAFKSQMSRYNAYSTYGFFQITTGAVMAVTLYTDRWLLSVAGTMDQVAIYAALMQVALAPTAFLFAILTRFWSPIYFATRNHSPKEQEKRFRLLLTSWAGAVSVTMGVTMISHHFLVRLLTSDTFAAFSHLLPWMVAALLIERTAQVLEMKGALLLKTKVYFVPRLSLIAIVPISEYICFKTLGFDGIAIGLVCATTALLVITAFVNAIFVKDTDENALPTTENKP